MTGTPANGVSGFFESDRLVLFAGICKSNGRFIQKSRSSRVWLWLWLRPQQFQRQIGLDAHRT
jgi:hypothetical protein